MTDAREREVTIESGDITLEGVLHLPAGAGPFPGVVICHPHPEYGGDMDNGVVLALRDAVIGRGIAALRFNFRGVGDSGGQYTGSWGEVNDATAAVGFLADQPEVEAACLGLAGYSFGAMISQKVADERVKALALVSLPVESFDFTRLNSFPGALLLVAGSRDWLVPRDRWEALATSLRREADFETVYGADHSWWGYESELEGIAGNFLARHLAGTGAEEEGS